MELLDFVLDVDHCLPLDLPFDDGEGLGALLTGEATGRLSCTVCAGENVGALGGVFAAICANKVALTSFADVAGASDERCNAMPLAAETTDALSALGLSRGITFLGVVSAQVALLSSILAIFVGGSTLETWGAEVPASFFVLSCCWTIGDSTPDFAMPPICIEGDACFRDSSANVATVPVSIEDDALSLTESVG